MKKTFKPFVKVNHRNGAVFLHIVRMSVLGRTSTVMRLSPTDAEAIGGELRQCALRARGRVKVANGGRGGG